MKLKSSTEINSWSVSSQSDKSSIYKVTIFADKHWECTCRSYEYANNKYCRTDKNGSVIKSCKHIEYVKEFYEEKKINNKKTFLVNL